MAPHPNLPYNTALLTGKPPQGAQNRPVGVDNLDQARIAASPEALGRPGALTIDDLLKVAIISQATAPTKNLKQFSCAALGVSRTYRKIFTNEANYLVKVFFWVDFSTANGDLRFSRQPNGIERVDQLNSSGRFVSNGILLAPKKALWVANYNPNDDTAAPLYTFTESDKINVGVFDLADIGMGN